MGASQSEEEIEHVTITNTICITVEIGVYGGRDRHWSGKIVGRFCISPEERVSSLLAKVVATVRTRNIPPVTVYTIHLGRFKPGESDMNRTVGEMGLRSGTLRIHNGMSD